MPRGHGHGVLVSVFIHLSHLLSACHQLGAFLETCRE